MIVVLEGAFLLVKQHKVLVKMMWLQKMLALSGVLQLLIVVHSLVNHLHFVFQVCMLCSININVIMHDNFNYVGISVTTSGPDHSSPATDLVSANQLADYDYIAAPLQSDSNGVALRCATGQGPTGSQTNNDLGDWYFGGAIIPVNQPCDSVFQVRQASFRNFPGIINLYPCGPLSPDKEGVYSCMMMNSSMMIQTTRVGLYLSGRSKSLDMYPLLTICHLSTQLLQ